MPNIDFEFINEENKIKDRVQSNAKQIGIAATNLGIAAKNNLKHNTTDKLRKSQIDKYSDASFYGDTVASMKIFSNEKKLERCKKEIKTLNELIRIVREELITAPKETSNKNRFVSGAVGGMTGGLAGKNKAYNKDKWDQILRGLEDNKKRFEKLKKDLSKTVREAAAIDW